MTTMALALLLTVPSQAVVSAPEAPLSAAYESLRMAVRKGGEVGLPRVGDPQPRPRPKGGCELSPATDAWGRVMARVCAQGPLRPADGIIPATRGLELHSGPRDVTHQSDYVNLWGAADEYDTLRPYEATFVSESWVIEADGMWHIDQWIMKLRLDGSLAGASHGYLVEELSGRVRDSGSYGAELADPKTKAKHEALLALWSGEKP